MPPLVLHAATRRNETSCSTCLRPGRLADTRRSWLRNGPRVSTIRAQVINLGRRVERDFHLCRTARRTREIGFGACGLAHLTTSRESEIGEIGSVPSFAEQDQPQIKVSITLLKPMEPDSVRWVVLVMMRSSEMMAEPRGFSERSPRSSEAAVRCPCDSASDSEAPVLRCREHPAIPKRETRLAPDVPVQQRTPRSR